MKNFTDLFNRKIILYKENLKHILKREEMKNQEENIALTLREPELIKRSISDKRVIIYYRYFQNTPVGDKYLSVVVKIKAKENFIITAYFTDRIKRGELIWQKN